VERQGACMYQDPASVQASARVAPQADILMRRLQELERALGVQEWWMLGRALPEAQVLAEVASLLAVARAELDQMLVQFCGQPPTAPVTANDSPTVPLAGDDAAALGRQRMMAAQLLHMLAAALPPTITFAQQLVPFARDSGMAGPAVDTLGIVADRLVEAYEALRDAPR
jgi:hypothetical protein